jgi:opacity protein-like surface antigen
VFPQTSLSLKNGYNAAGAFGIYQGNMRGEVEFSYRNNDISHVVNNPGVTSTGGGLSAFSIMFNGFADVPLTKRLSFYGGGGLGIAFVDLNAKVSQVVGPSYEIDSSSPTFALQGIVGLNFQLSRRICLTGGYRLWTAFGVDASFVSTGAGSIAHINSNNHFDLPLIHGPEVGLRIDL